MKVYLTVPKNTEVLDGTFNYDKIANDNYSFHSNLAEALEVVKGNSDLGVLEGEFTNYSELIDAVNASLHGDYLSHFTIKWNKSYSMKDLG